MVGYKFAVHFFALLSCALVPAQIHVYGFDHKAPLMLREVLKRLLDLGPHLKEGEPAQQSTHLNVAGWFIPAYCVVWLWSSIEGVTPGCTASCSTATAI